jgi:hypothetical protein
MTFRACSSPALTPVKPQPAPAILSQELVHTTLSITHHTMKRPSIGPRTTHGPLFSLGFLGLAWQLHGEIFWEGRMIGQKLDLEKPTWPVLLWQQVLELFSAVCSRVLLGEVLFLVLVALQWLHGFVKRSVRRSPSDLGFKGWILG